jgi:hypothetical protein
VKFANGRDALLAVNADPRESDLQPVADDVLKLWSGAGTGQAEPVSAGAESQQGISHLWWWIMLLVAITAVAETAVASGYLGTEREAL